MEVDIYFEEQNIHTMSGDGELMMTILASYAQEESRSASENQKWRIKRNFEAGIPWDGTLLGYRLKNSHYVIVPKEAELVRRIYLKKYEALTKRYEAAAAELERLQNLRTLRSQKDKSMALYIRTLKKQPEVLQEWNDTIWNVMVEKAIVHRNGEITFVFYNSTEISVGA